jgi:hypothetical protein
LAAQKKTSLDQEPNMSHPGRKRKSNVTRDASGKSRGEPEGVHPETIAVRLRELAREGVAVRDRQGALDALAGFTLGRLLLRNRADRGDPGSINEQQYNAGQEWAKLVRRHAMIMGYALGTPKSPSFVLIGAGLSCTEGPDEAEIIAVRRQWSDCYRALMDVCRTHGLAVRDIVYAVCIDNRNINSLSATDFGNLRIGLNALVKVLRTEAPEPQGRIGVWRI